MILLNPKYLETPGRLETPRNLEMPGRVETTKRLKLFRSKHNENQIELIWPDKS